MEIKINVSQKQFEKIKRRAAFIDFSVEKFVCYLVVNTRVERREEV